MGPISCAYSRKDREGPGHEAGPSLYSVWHYRVWKDMAATGLYSVDDWRPTADQKLTQFNNDPHTVGGWPMIDATCRKVLSKSDLAGRQRGLKCP